MYFQNIYPDLVTFKTDLFSYTNDFSDDKNNIFNFKNNTNRYTTPKILFLWFNKIFIGRSLRYDKISFKTQFWSTFIEHYPNLYIQQLVYANKQLEKLIEANSRGTTQSNTPVGSMESTNYTATTNVGKLNTSDDPFNLKKETIYQKTGNKNTTTYKDRVTTNNQQDLYLNAIAITNSTMNFGLAQFFSNFDYLAKQIFVPNLLFETGVVPQPIPTDIKFDTDTVKKINDRYTVVGIKDE